MTTSAIPLTSTAWVDLGATPLVVCAIDDRQPAVLVVADAAPDLATQGILATTRDENGVQIYGAGQHVSINGDASVAIPGGMSNASQTTGYSTASTFGTWPTDLTSATLGNATIGRNPIIQFLAASVP